MGFILFIFILLLYDILEYFKLDYLVKINFLTRITFHLIESLIILYAFYLMDDSTSNLIYSVLFIILIVIPLSEYRIVRNKESDFR